MPRDLRVFRDELVIGNPDFAGAGERIRTVDLRIPSASSGDLPQSGESPESPNSQNMEIPETDGNDEDP
jgi:hypothetical protein